MEKRTRQWYNQSENLYAILNSGTANWALIAGFT